MKTFDHALIVEKYNQLKLEHPDFDERKLLEEVFKRLSGDFTEDYPVEQYIRKGKKGYPEVVQKHERGGIIQNKELQKRINQLAIDKEKYKKKIEEIRKNKRNIKATKIVIKKEYHAECAFCGKKLKKAIETDEGIIGWRCYLNALGIPPPPKAQLNLKDLPQQLFNDLAESTIEKLEKSDISKIIPLLVNPNDVENVRFLSRIGISYINKITGKYNEVNLIGDLWRLDEIVEVPKAVMDKITSTEKFNDWLRIQMAIQRKSVPGWEKEKFQSFYDSYYSYYKNELEREKKNDFTEDLKPKYYCQRCKANHFLDSEIGKKHVALNQKSIKTKKEEKLVIYHETPIKNIENIKKEGLKSPIGVNPAKWYQVTTSFEGAQKYRGEMNDRAILEYHIPIDKINEYLWMKGAFYSKDYGNQIGIKKPIPNEFLNKIHRFDENNSLIDRAKELLEKGKYILPKRTKGIIEGEIKNYNEGKKHELEEWIPIFEKKYERLKIQQEEEKKEKEKFETRMLKPYLEMNIQELEKQLTKLQKEKKQLWEKESQLRPDERTQIKATIKNRQESSSQEIERIEKTLMKKKEITYQQLYEQYYHNDFTTDTLDSVFLHIADAYDSALEQEADFVFDAETDPIRSGTSNIPSGATRLQRLWETQKLLDEARRKANELGVLPTVTGPTSVTVPFSITNSENGKTLQGEVVENLENNTIQLTPVSSSNVRGAGQFKNELLVQFHPNKNTPMRTYRYTFQSPEHATEAYRALTETGSPGRWIWQNIRGHTAGEKVTSSKVAPSLKPPNQGLPTIGGTSASIVPYSISNRVPVERVKNFDEVLKEMKRQTPNPDIDPMTGKRIEAVMGVAKGLRDLGVAGWQGRGLRLPLSQTDFVNFEEQQLYVGLRAFYIKQNFDEMWKKRETKTVISFLTQILDMDEGKIYSLLKKYSKDLGLQWSFGVGSGIVEGIYAVLNFKNFNIYKLKNEGEGKGWWGESERHSKARKVGKADFVGKLIPVQKITSINELIEDYWITKKGKHIWIKEYHRNADVAEKLHMFYEVNPIFKIDVRVDLDKSENTWGMLSQFYTAHHLPIKLLDCLKEVRIYNKITDDPSMYAERNDVPEAYKKVGWNKTYSETGGVYLIKDNVAILSKNETSSTLMHELGHGVWYKLTEKDKKEFEQIHNEVKDDLLKNAKTMMKGAQQDEGWIKEYYENKATGMEYEANDVEELFAESFKRYYDSKERTHLNKQLYKEEAHKIYQQQYYPKISKFMRERMKKYES